MTEVSNESSDNFLVDRLLIILFNRFRFSPLRQHRGDSTAYVGPPLGFNNCTVNSNPTVTSKSVQTTIFWTVGSPLTQIITDSGENKDIGGVFTNCLRCFPEFDAAQWTEPSPGVTGWSQKIFQVFVTSQNTCAVDGLRAV